MLTAIRRVFKAGFVGFWRSAYVSLTSVYVITIALFVIGSGIFVDQLLNKTFEIIESRVDINVYFVKDAAQEEIDRLRDAIAALPDVVSVGYTSREEALQEYRERNQDNATSLQALEQLDENPLGAKLTIQARETSQYGQIAQFLTEQKALETPQTAVIDNINYERNKVAIDSLTAIIAAVKSASIIIMGVLLLAAVIITFNTIRLAIYTSREEIAIMRLVGASNMFIRGPFMLQGIMYGLISGLVTLAIFYPIMVWLGPKTEAFFELNLLTYYLDNIVYICAVLVGVGVVLGLVSSTLAVARYLRT